MIRHPELPPVPEGAEITPWSVSLPPGFRLSPRDLHILLTHVSHERWQFLASLLHEQIGEAGDPRSGLVGHRYAASPVKGGALYETSEEIRALAMLEGTERDRCARLAAEAHAMGLTDDDWK